MAKSKASLKEIRDKVAARKAQRKAKKADKYAKMRLVAAKAPEKMEKHLIRLADKYASMAEAVENLRVNLGLVRAAKEAPLKVRVAATKTYGKKFIRIAEEAPEKLESALVEAYNGLNDIAADIEFAAEQMGVPLEAEEGMVTDGMEFEPESIAEGEHEVVEEAEKAGLPVPEEVEEHVEEEESDTEEDFEPEEKEAAGGDAWVTDRDESGNPQAPENVDVPRVAAGTDACVTDRDKDAQPSAPKEAASKKAMTRKDYIILADALRSFRMPNQQREDFAKHLSKYLRSDNYRFNERIFVDYVMGVGGNRGGSEFKADPPNNSDLLF